jgi:hypothetical protein
MVGHTAIEEVTKSEAEVYQEWALRLARWMQTIYELWGEENEDIFYESLTLHTLSYRKRVFELVRELDEADRICRVVAANTHGQDEE